jgi:hypothetical protein
MVSHDDAGAAPRQKIGALAWPKRFRVSTARAMVEGIVPVRRRTLVARRLEALLDTTTRR